MTGQIIYEEPSPLTDYEVWRRLTNRKSSMSGRCARAHADASRLATGDQLYKLYKRNPRCAITGHTTFVHRTADSTLPAWAVTLDHRNPLKYSKNDAKAWSVNNLQILGHIMNLVKNSCSDDDAYN